MSSLQWGALDWEAWRIGLGAFDLGCMVAVRWYPERRAWLGRSFVGTLVAGSLGRIAPAVHGDRYAVGVQ
jgi:hypothetical protein